MDAVAPPVVAVVVAHDPGPWFEEALAALAAQDYAELSVLVADTGADPDLASRVASVAPAAYVTRVEGNPGFAAAVNAVRGMVQGAAYFLLCHDDVAPDPDAVHLMVEEAFRSNAGIVAPKLVHWNDRSLLLHVGMAADKGGAPVDRVHPDEIDHGQLDGVRDVFVAPGGCTLVRADLFEELGGLDPVVVAMGEDLDLCWRARVAGARVIVAPDARVRHLEGLAAGTRPVGELADALVAVDRPGGARDTGTIAATEGAGTTGTIAATEGAGTTGTIAATEGAGITENAGEVAHSADSRLPTLQELQRRHELRAVLTCYTRFHLLRVLPQLVVLAVAEVVVARLAGNRTRARAVVRAWRWNLARRSEIRRRRTQVAAVRRVPDREVRAFQIGGSARLASYFRRLFQHGFHGAHADELEVDTGPEAAALAAGGAAPAESGAGDSAGRSSRLVGWLVAALVVVIGTRGVIGGRLPVVGQFVAFPGWSPTWAAFVGGWHPGGLGTTAPSTPALALTGLVGTLLLGAMGLAQKVLVLGCLPVGVWGTVRLLRPFGSPRAAFVAGLAYLGVAVPYNALAQGRWGALVVYAGFPWVAARLFRATGLAPFGAPPVRRHSAARSGRWRSVVALGVIEAVLVSFAPAAALVVVGAAAALVLSSAFDGTWRATLGALRTGIGATVVAAVLCLPWVVGVVLAGGSAVNVFGVPIPASEAPTWSSLLRFSVGPVGGSVLAWGFVVAAVVTLLLARGDRFAWARRLWVLGLTFAVLAWVVGRGWTAPLAVESLILLVPLALALAATIGLGVAALEEDLSSSVFGWRQLAVVVAVVATAAAVVPTVVSALPGRWDLPETDFSQSVQWMPPPSAAGAYRVLWLADPRALNQGGWPAGGGLAYATSDDGAPDARWLWAPASSGPAGSLATAVNQAQDGRTQRLGRQLAPAGVRYVVVLTALAPVIPGQQTPERLPVGAGLLPALDQQLDLTQVVSGTGMTVFQNAAWVPVRAHVTAITPPGATPTSATRAPAPASGVAAVLPGPRASSSYSGPVPAGTVVSAMAPAAGWHLTTASGQASRRDVPSGWLAAWRVPDRGLATLGFAAGAWPWLALLVTVVAWVAAVLLLVGRPRTVSPGGRGPGRRWHGGTDRGNGGGTGDRDEPPPRAFRRRSARTGVTIDEPDPGDLRAPPRVDDPVAPVMPDVADVPGVPGVPDVPDVADVHPADSADLSARRGPPP